MSKRKMTERKDKQWATIHYTENGLCQSNHTIIRGVDTCASER